MKPSLAHLQHACRITLFTRQNCSLCTNARAVLSTVWDRRPFEYTEVDVMKPEGRRWRDLYEFDTPVIHISSTKSLAAQAEAEAARTAAAEAAAEETPELAGKARKLMHRFTAEQVHEKMDGAEEEGL